MSTVDTRAARSPAATTFVRRAGAICLWAGLLGAASGVFLAVIPAAVPPERFSYPLAAGAFVAIQLWFFVQHLGLLLGQAALWRTGVAGRSRAAWIGHAIAFAGMALLAVTEVIATTSAEDLYPSENTDPLDVLYGVSSLATGLGLIIVGVAVVRAGVWQGARRWLPLVLGVWVYVPMTPALMAGHIPARLSIAGWMLLYAALGWALTRADRGRV
ncbi:hypothetical protein [Actinokineospora sp.]|uniref:hypothetical protein n=1 Tax=Actinokineospora sp. TaxID=1872133 RepID=UPI003D6ADBF8